MNDEIRAAGASTYDIRIEQVQRAEVVVDTLEDANRWIGWLSGMGYHAFGPFPWTDDKIKVDFTIMRETIADTRLGDAVAFDGRYTKQEDR